MALLGEWVILLTTFAQSLAVVEYSTCTEQAAALGVRPGVSVPGCGHDHRMGVASDVFSYTFPHRCFCGIGKQTTERHHLTPVRRATLEKTRNNKCWRGRGEKGALRAAAGKSGRCSHRGRQGGRLKALNVGLPCDPAAPLQGIHPKKTRTVTWEKHGQPHFTAA